MLLWRKILFLYNLARSTKISWKVFELWKAVFNRKNTILIVHMKRRFKFEVFQNGTINVHHPVCCAVINKNMSAAFDTPFSVMARYLCIAAKKFFAFCYLNILRRLKACSSHWSRRPSMANCAVTNCHYCRFTDNLHLYSAT